MCLRTAKSASLGSAKQSSVTRPNVYITHLQQYKGSMNRPRFGTGRRNVDSKPASVEADAFSISNGCLTACGTEKDPAPRSLHCFTIGRHRYKLHNTILPALGPPQFLLDPLTMYGALCVEPCRIVRLFAPPFVRQEVVVFSGHSFSPSLCRRF
jgi:hypothetical protein